MRLVAANVASVFSFLQFCRWLSEFVATTLLTLLVHFKSDRVFSDMLSFELARLFLNKYLFRY